MAKTAAVYGRVDPVVKAEVDSILKALGLSQSTLIQMVYNEIYLTRKIPVSLAMPSKRSIFMEEMAQDELNHEIQKGLDQAKAEKLYTAEEVEEMLKKEFHH